MPLFNYLKFTTATDWRYLFENTRTHVDKDIVSLFTLKSP